MAAIKSFLGDEMITNSYFQKTRLILNVAKGLSAMQG